MAHCSKYAQRLISELEPFLPEGAERVLERAGYWDAGVCDRFLERCEDFIFHDPHAGLKLAEVAPRYVETLPVDDSPGGRREHRARVEALAALKLWSEGWKRGLSAKSCWPRSRSG